MSKIKNFNRNAEVEWSLDSVGNSSSVDSYKYARRVVEAGVGVLSTRTLRDRKSRKRIQGCTCGESWNQEQLR